MPRWESIVAHTMLDETQIRDLFREAFEEMLRERKDLLYDLLAEIVEDSGLLRAIQEGEETETVPREEVFRVLEGKS
jgi:hypothetical protein